MTDILTFDSRDEADKKAAVLIKEAIDSILEEKDTIILAIPGGRSVSGIFNQLILLDIPWISVHIFMVDERLVPIDHEDSNFKLAKENFIDQLLSTEKIPEQNIHPFILESMHEDKGISDYEAKIVQYGGIYDIILLSAGEDGHVAALYPNHHSISDSSECYLIMNDSPKPPSERMTSSKKLLESANTAVLLFYGDSKRDALEKYKASDDVTTLPCRLVKKIKNSFVLTDLK